MPAPTKNYTAPTGVAQRMEYSGNPGQSSYQVTPKVGAGFIIPAPIIPPPLEPLEARIFPPCRCPQLADIPVFEPPPGGVT